ncbi:hypothetical protein TNCV_1407001 [Trichonephila clavipes]|nr:hypothetical protein TNCV_1407001 [Trichonephila clavipes]
MGNNCRKCAESGKRENSQNGRMPVCLRKQILWTKELEKSVPGVLPDMEFEFRIESPKYPQLYRTMPDDRV